MLHCLLVVEVTTPEVKLGKRKRKTTNMSIEFLETVASELIKNKTWDNGSFSPVAVADICVEVCDLFGIEAKNDGRFITVE